MRTERRCFQPCTVDPCRRDARVEGVARGRTAAMAWLLFGSLGAGLLGPRAGRAAESAPDIPLASSITTAEPGPLEPSPSVAPSSDELLARRRVTVVLYDSKNAATLLYRTMAAEVERLFRELDIVVLWRRAAPQDVTVKDEIQVILLDSKGTSALSRTVLGATRRTGVQAVWAYLPNVTAALGLSGDAMTWSLRQREETAIALGRVVAHELVHVLVPQHPHTGAGLMSATLGRMALVAPGMHFDPVTAQAFSQEQLTQSAGTPPLATGLDAAMEDARPN
jgi:hypothetical protein